MKEYEFILNFALVDTTSNPEDYIERLEKEGCSDALIGLGKKGHISLNFIREAESPEKAFKTAVDDVKRAIPEFKLIE